MDIPGYRISKKIGQGGMATVYLAVQESLGREVALKVMNASLSAQEGFADRFLKESRIVAGLQHPQIVIVHDFGSRDGHSFFSMEYLPGGTLKERILAGMDPNDSADLIRQIADALGHAHQQGVIHRDIKPQNILFRRNGTPVLTDFGIAKRLDSATQITKTNMSIGSPGYMSPEQINSKPLDARADLYSLGVLFYEMLTQRLPYEADEMVTMAVMHCTAPIPALPAHVSRFQPLIDWLLAKVPQDRPNSAAEFVEALDRVMEEGAAGFSVTETLDLGSLSDVTEIESRSQNLEAETVVIGPRVSKSRTKRGLLALLTVFLFASLLYWLSTPDLLSSMREQLERLPPGPLKERLLSRIEARDRAEHPRRLLSSCRSRFPVETLAAEDASKALDCYRQLLTFESDSADIRTLLDDLSSRFVEWARGAIRDGRLEEARKQMENLAAIRPGDQRLVVLERELRLAPWYRAGANAGDGEPLRPNWAALDRLVPGDGGFRVEASLNSPVVIGDAIDFEVTSQQPGRLWILSVDQEDQVHLIFPNGHAESNWVEARDTRRIPPAGANWVIEAAEPAGDNKLLFLVLPEALDLEAIMDSAPSDQVGTRLVQRLSSMQDWGMAAKRLEIESK